MAVRISSIKLSNAFFLIKNLRIELEVGTKLIAFIVDGGFVNTLLVACCTMCYPSTGGSLRNVLPIPTVLPPGRRSDNCAFHTTKK
jgi:hypothetical protein